MSKELIDKILAEVGLERIDYSEESYSIVSAPPA